jgi:hypothetical protein
MEVFPVYAMWVKWKLHEPEGFNPGHREINEILAKNILKKLGN